MNIPAAMITGFPFGINKVERNYKLLLSFSYSVLFFVIVLFLHIEHIQDIIV